MDDLIFNNLKESNTFIYKLHGTINNEIIEQLIDAIVSNKIVFVKRPIVNNTILEVVTNFLFFSYLNDVNTWNLFDNIKLNNYVIYNNKFDNINNYLINKFKEIYPDKIIIRLFLANLPSNNIIKMHTDGGNFFKYINRILIPIITDDSVFFTIENNIFNMKKGIIYEINNLKMHQCINKSKNNRIHLICDLMDKYYINFEEN